MLKSLFDVVGEDEVNSLGFNLVFILNKLLLVVDWLEFVLNRFFDWLFVVKVFVILVIFVVWLVELVLLLKIFFVKFEILFCLNMFDWLLVFFVLNRFDWFELFEIVENLFD